MRFGLVGAGRIAQTYAQALSVSPRARLHAVADIRPDAAKALAEAAGCMSFDSHRAMAAEANIEAAIVCTPPASHPEICIDLVRCGLHVLCEKPFSIHSGDATRMVDEARKAGTVITMASKFRYVEDVIRARSIVESGSLGEIVLFENAFTSSVDMVNRWNSDPAISGGGVLIDNGTHSLDLARYFLGPLVDLQVAEGKRCQPLRVEDTVRVFVRSRSGVIGHIDLSWSINKSQDTYVGIYGRAGTVLVGWKQSRLLLFSDREWQVIGQGYDKVQAFSAQIDNLARSLQDGERLLIDADDAVASVEAVEAAYAALQHGQWTTIGNGNREHHR
ncbi:MAG: Gfo/Idh/MocA family oxidoreductase [Planctomycetota bacterium]